MELHHRAAEAHVEGSTEPVGLDRGPGPGDASLDLDLDHESRSAAGRGARRADRSGDLLTLLARRLRRGDRPAVVGAEPLTWATLAEHVELAAGVLATAGVGLDDVVLLPAAAPAARLVGLLAVAHLGAVAVPVAPRDRPGHPAWRSVAAALVDAADADRPGSASVPRVALHRDGRPVEPSGAPVVPAVRPSARSGLRVVAHPGASAGADGPRIARRHGQLVAEGLALALALRLDADDVVLAAAGLDTALGLAFGVLVPLAAGATLLDPATADPSAATVVAADPGWFAELAAGQRVDGPFERLRWCVTDDAVPGDVARAVSARHGVAVRRAYGRPETGLVLADVGSRPFHDPSAIGVGLPGVDVRIVDADGRDRAPGAMGEIAVRAPWMAEPGDAPGAPGAAGARVVDGELRTGHHGCFDDAGGLVLVAGRQAVRDRADLDPDAVRAVLADHPAVAAVTVTAVSAPTGAQLLKAVVVAGERCDRRELLEWCRRHLPEPAVPALIEFRRELGVRAVPVGDAPAAARATTLEVVPLTGPPAPAVVLPVDPLAARLTG